MVRTVMCIQCRLCIHSTYNQVVCPQKNDYHSQTLLLVYSSIHYTVCHCSLQEYLNELLAVSNATQSNGTGSQNGSDGTENRTNFAQAALVLQQSSFVYSRKVEYLYSLVYQALEQLSENSRNSNEGGKGSRRSNNHSAMDEIEQYDPYQEFLLLDDVVPCDSADHNRQSISLMEPDEVSRSLLYRSPHGRRSSWMTAGAGGDMTSTLLLNATANMSTHKRGSYQPLFQLLEGACPDEDEYEHYLAAPLAAPSPLFGYNNDNDNDMDDDEAPDDGAGFTMHMPMDHDDSANTPFSPRSTNPILTQQSVAPENMQQTRTVMNPPPPKKPSNPWKYCDPHDPTGNDRPLQRGRTIRLPPGLHEWPSDCVTGARTRRRPASRAALTAPPLALPPWTFRLETVPLTGWVLGTEFHYMRTHFRAEQRRQAAKEQRERELQQYALPIENNAWEHDDMDNDDNEGGWGFGGDDDNDSIGNNTNTHSNVGLHMNAMEREGFEGMSRPHMTIVWLLLSHLNPFLLIVRSKPRFGEQLRRNVPCSTQKHVQRKRKVFQRDGSAQASTCMARSTSTHIGRGRSTTMFRHFSLQSKYH
jgi:condensin-2 complex subunit H2